MIINALALGSLYSYGAYRLPRTDCKTMLDLTLQGLRGVIETEHVALQAPVFEVSV